MLLAELGFGGAGNRDASLRGWKGSKTPRAYPSISYVKGWELWGV